MYKIGRVQIYLIIIAALFAQITFLNYIKVFGAKPDLMLLCVVFFAIFLGPAAGLEAGIVSGILQDTFALDFFWINTFVFAVTGLMVGALNGKFFKESKRMEFIIVFFSTAFAMACHFMLATFFAKSNLLGFTDYLFSSIIPCGLYTGLAAIPVYSQMIRVFDLKENEDFL